MSAPRPPQRPPRPPQVARQVSRTSPGPRRSSSGGGGIIALGVLAAVGAGWYFLRTPTESPATDEPIAKAPESTPAPSIPAPAGAEKAKPAPIDIGEAGSDPEGRKKTAEVPTTPMPTEVAPKPAETESSTATAKAKVEYPDKLSLDTTGATSTAEVAKAERALSDALRSGDWPGYSNLLERSLKAELGRCMSFATVADYKPYFENPHFSLAFTRHAFFASLDEASLTLFAEDAGMAEPLKFLLSTPELMESWLTTVKPDDKKAEALKVWFGLLSEFPESRTRFRELALACALVYEKPKSYRWNEETVKADAESRFLYYQRHSQEGDLVGKVHEMSARDLVWVVCAPVPESEMEWALKKLRLRQAGWGSAYGMVEYDMEKAVKGTNRYDSYTFDEILKKGGICGDRAYFSANTARACGVPAAELSGDGDRGPHAWVVWMADEGKWQTAGRFSGYPMGSAGDPQTGKRTTEQEFIWRSEERHATQTAVVRAARYLWLAQLHQKLGQPESANIAMNLALKQNDCFPPIWAATIEWWLANKKEAPIDEWKKMVDKLKKDFREDTVLMDLARKAEEEAIFPRQDVKVTMKDLKRDARKMEKESEEGGATAKAEEQIKPLKRQAGLYITAGNLQGVRDLYKSALNDCEDPSVFKAIAKDLFQSVKENAELAATACHDMESAYKRNIDKGGDYFAITSQSSVLKQIAKYYRELGNTDKATSLEKEIERRNGKASRKAI